MKKSPVILVLATACGLVFGQSPTLQELEAQERALSTKRQREQSLRHIDEISATLQKVEQDFQLACVKAFGSQSFCLCINHSIPGIFSFVDYVKITTQSKTENNYGALDKGAQRAYDKVAAVRDMCVATANKK